MREQGRLGTLLKAGTIFLLLVAVMMVGVEAAADKAPVWIGITAEYGLPNSFSAQAVEMGIRVALSEINQAGGVLGGRPLALEVRDDRSVPARAIQNLKELGQITDMTAVFGARFSPVLLEMMPVVHEIGMILLNPWASADGVTRHEYQPNYAFRLSLKDSLAMPKLLSTARKRGFTKVGLMLPNTAWGRSNQQAAEKFIGAQPASMAIISRWYNWGDASLIDLYDDLFSAKAQAIILVANDREGGILLNEIHAQFPPEKYLPILSHWGVTGGEFFKNTRTIIHKFDFSIIQTFSFFTADADIRERFMATAARLYPLKQFEEIQAPVGVGHAYDLTYLLALAIEKAGTTSRPAIRKALEELGPFRGLVASLNRPFSPENHDALGSEHIFMAKYREDGVLVPIAEH